MFWLLFVLAGVETRTSAPVCIERGQDLECVSLRGLYPCGEGAGYAGVSAHTPVRVCIFSG